MNKGLNNNKMTALERYSVYGTKEATDTVIVVDNYEIPEPREGKWNPAIDSDGNVILECYLLPLSFIKIEHDKEFSNYITTSNWVVNILGKQFGFCKVEFPILDAMQENDNVSLVKLYRAKMERK